MDYGIVGARIITDETHQRNESIVILPYYCPFTIHREYNLRQQQDHLRGSAKWSAAHPFPAGKNKIGDATTLMEVITNTYIILLSVRNCTYALVQRMGMLCC